MFRPEVKVVDCTIRDGGLMNEWQFDRQLVKDVFHGLVQAGVDYVELGYKADKSQFSTEKFGPWRFCDEEDLREVAYACDTKVAVMVDVGRTDMNTILPAEDSLVRLYRVATYLKDIVQAIEMGEEIKARGYQTACNIMAVSHEDEKELDAAIARLADTSFDVVYLVDSFGNMDSRHIHYLAEKYLTRLPNQQIGIHTHNNQQLAFSNTVESVFKGINYLDASIFGIGRAAGNCCLELLLGFLQNPRYDVRPVLDLIQKYFLRMRQDLVWGYEIPYAITGMLNKHPQAALSFMRNAESGSFSAFYDELTKTDKA